ncbi:MULTISPECIES: hypothetical protein [unclassified Streptomyces]|uniref:hypothetical protein n=1 Tax=unclassified Streptomyces TaxID=2593676 RepID=UPI001F04306B|nr:MULTISPECIES: hypothetical protein [unclassified Streptomyces]MCH0562543.1 hypothetical protein [Streptomyces sp. MUM 2J]MCH0572625.1 hypothetical protein [Streptomyces sp. MUM 136J]
MLRIIDDRTGEPVEAAPVRRGLTRIEAHAPGYDPTALRVLLVTDLLVRALELGGTPVWALLDAPRQQAELRAGAAALGMRPLEDSRDVAAGLGEAQVVHVAPQGAGIADGVLLAVGPVEVEPGEPVTDADPAAVRLALLGAPRTAAVRLDPAVLAAAGDTLARRRHAVADWARRPSRPVPDAVRARLRAAWENDLDIPAVLRVLHDVAQAPPGELPDGARFETYVHADRLLGLDLARDVGAPS